jgi:hypothetical protein
VKIYLLKSIISPVNAIVGIKLEWVMVEGGQA